MTRGLRAFVEGIIDYAGLFPPAKLDLDPAIRNFARYRESDERWMLARFICPAPRLEDLASYHDELFTAGEPFRFSVLARPAVDAEMVATLLAEDLESLDAFLARHDDRVTVDALELKLPTAALGRSMLSRLLPELAEALARRGDIMPWIEIPRGSSWGNDLTALLGGLEEAREMDDLRVGFKLRCGGVEADAFPSIEEVAMAMVGCRDHGVPMKFTAGLHHPIRHHDATVDATMHGFVNVFTAGALAFVHDAHPDTLMKALSEEDATRFGFSDEGLTWNDHALSVEEIEAARAEAVLSYGSCSFDEPRDDLRALGLL